MKSANRFLLLGFLVIPVSGFCIASSGPGDPPGQPAPRILTQGLVLERPGRRVRSPLILDAVEKALAAGTWKIPSAGDSVDFGAQGASVWKPINADTSGWFNRKILRSAYVFLPLEMDAEGTVLVESLGPDLFFTGGAPRIGNRYGYKEEWAGWEPRFDFSLIPVPVHRGKNDLLFRCTRGRLKVKIHPVTNPLLLNTRDVTLPDLILDRPADTWGAVVVINATDRARKDLVITGQWESGEKTATALSEIPPMTVRKAGFRIRRAAPAQPGKEKLLLVLENGPEAHREIQDTATLFIPVRSPLEIHKRTFISDIDGSVQYYAVNPARRKEGVPSALILTVHGAGVEALNQANAYSGKSWAHIVAPTNRRPFGFDWEDWGRMDAVEVLNHAERDLSVNPGQIYLTGHSMGGHGTWHLGALYPCRFGAIGPSAGWISFSSYAARQSARADTPMEEMMRRALLPGQTLELMENYRSLGIYILHGGADDNVPPGQARTMNDSLKTFHSDFVYHEQPGAGHWWDISDEPGTDCVDWAPMMDFFARHARPLPEQVRQVDFRTPNPAISSRCHWAEISAQIHPLRISRICLRLDPGQNRWEGETENVARLALDTDRTAGDKTLTVRLDGDTLKDIPMPDGDRLWLQRDAEKGWRISDPPSPDRKGPHRYGPFKQAFRNRVVFVYGTKGSEAENRWAFSKARFDAESFWYQGNGSVDLIPDTRFRPEAYMDRNVILYGNARTNAAWDNLLKGCPVRVDRGRVRVGSRTWKGENLACLFIYPRRDSDTASVGVVSGSGIHGMRLTDTRPVFFAGYGYPDCVVFSPDANAEGNTGVAAAGVFGLDWKVASGDFQFTE
jgi:dienelactone hydrolase